MNDVPTKEQLAAIKAECDPSQDAQANWHRLTSAEFKNPVPQGQVPIYISMSYLYATPGISVASVGKVLTWANLPYLDGYLRAQDHASVAQILSAIPAAGLCTPDESKALIWRVWDGDGPVMVPDPDWQELLDFGTSHELFGEPIPYSWVLEAVQ